LSEQTLLKGVHAIAQKIHGVITSLKAGDVRALEQFYRKRLPPDRVVTQEYARSLTELSRRLGRQVGVLVNRRGETEIVILGDNRQIVIPDLEGRRGASSRLTGLRLLHTHLQNEPLSREDLTDLALLRLDLVAALTMDEKGLPGPMHLAHLVPENPRGDYWLIMEPARPSEFTLDFAAFIQALEGELAGRQALRKVDSTDRAILVSVTDGGGPGAEESMAEMKELARTCGVEVFDTLAQRRARVDPRFILGRGKLSHLVMKALQIDANLLIFDRELTPGQARSIADVTELKVIDRTQLILDIFAQRAHSRDGKIQVELAQLKYMLPRLAKKNTAMSRLTGGIGGRGPGETKLEVNRRHVRDRIHRLEKEIAGVRRGRAQRRSLRQREGLPVISIVGYTNAGKSTLLNALTGSNVLAENRLFATLDPKSSRLRFPRDRSAVITDTVGFIRDLPKELAAAFRATLEELDEADLLIQVIDIANPAFEEQMAAVESILTDLELARKPMIRVFNKIDLCPDRAILENIRRRHDGILVSARDPSTFGPLLERIEGVLVRGEGL
jgi:GTPase